MGNFDEAVRALPPPSNHLTCPTCGRSVPLTGDAEHDIRLDAGPGDTHQLAVVCLVEPA